MVETKEIKLSKKDVENIIKQYKEAHKPKLVDFITTATGNVIGWGIILFLLFGTLWLVKWSFMGLMGW